MRPPSNQIVGVACVLVEKAIVVVAITEHVSEAVAARRVIQALEAGNFVDVKIDGFSPLARLFGSEPGIRDRRAILDQALKYARDVVAWHETAAGSPS